MELIKVIFLGIIQGLTEFLPISSSGHLVLAAELLHYQEEGVAFEVFVHLGTLFSVLVVFRKRIYRMIIAPFRVLIFKDRRTDYVESAQWVLFIIIGTIPAAVIGLIFKQEIELFFSNIILVIFMLFLTGSIMIASRFITNRNEDVTSSKSFLIGVAQAFAILPGISRSGSTIVMGILLGINRSKAAEFSFLLSIPAILGATVLKINDLFHQDITSSQVILLLVGMISAFISGYLAILWLLDVVKKGRLEWFGIYCYTVVFLSLIWYVFS